MKNIKKQIMCPNVDKIFDQGLEIARQMLCNSLGMEIDSFGKACAQVDKLIWEKERNEKAAFDRWLVS